MTELSHDIKLLGLIMPDGDEVGSYFKELPEHFTKCINFRSLYRLKKRKRTDSKENLEINEGMDIVIHDPGAQKYFYKVLHHMNDMNKMLKYFKDGNLYILKDEYLPKEEAEEVDLPPAPEKKDDTELIF
jgi:hypothetical protein